MQHAIRSGDADLAESEMRTHLQTILPSLDHLMDQYPDYFEPEDRDNSGRIAGAMR